MIWARALRDLGLLAPEPTKVECRNCTYFHDGLTGPRPGCAHLAHAGPAHPITGVVRLGNHRWINRDGRCSDYQTIEPPAPEGDQP